MDNKEIRVIELFAGVGGFRIGLEGYNGKSASSNFNKKMSSNYNVIWSNQFEPLTPNNQYASIVYEAKFGKEGHSNQDIEKVIETNFDSIPNHDLLVGGFPCQDYSVATTLKNSKGLIGKKGVLWWSIYSIIKKKEKDKPKFLFLENVDRLLVSPSLQRGRDFAVILSCLYEQGYAVEWRIINAADYSMPQRRKRIYIIAYHQSSSIYKKIISCTPKDWILNKGVLGKAFPVLKNELDSNRGCISNDPKIVSDEFNKGKKVSPFFNSGLFLNGEFTTFKTKPEIRPLYPLKKILQNINDVSYDFYISPELKLKKELEKKQIDSETIYIKNELDMWKYLKGKKKEERINKINGFKYKYAEGSMTFPDDLDKPSRTIITGEGGKSPSRFKHVIQQESVYRRLTPIELERLNMFPDNHTKFEGITDSKRAFFMGNALVVGVIEKIGLELFKQINNG
ncbi:DNA (cytosine-5-)-methyltransferase [Flavobacterium sp. AS60]|uniref:DNA (cytosine-5-)-methyltransferase n=1 Tax=Flavobacterium anseongense TaxID=2910677 RepID=UPI001F247E50|nr:DNA (cytosine-5-)-methyltransferase [Flavobacterium sp. AS60]MCF6130125.1 DNA (cytosine-5-)-methyltransferase [Flavobacterium sp. AS60]